jgi:uncharacterized protein (TIGR03435 family)
MKPYASNGMKFRAPLSLAAAGLLWAAPQSFEVASIKANRSDSQRAPSAILPGGRFTATNNTVRDLILNAYGISATPYRLTGGPSWIDSERYDVDAKAEANAVPPGTAPKDLWAKTRLMLRALLADRFHLVMRTESKEMPVYELTVAKGGPKLQRSNLDCGASVNACHGFSGGPRQLTGAGVDSYDLALELSYRSGRLVTDKTGLTGVFDFKLQWNPFADRAQPAEAAQPTAGSTREGGGRDPGTLPGLATALEEQAGLRLESRKGPVEVYVIERIERPSEN